MRHRHVEQREADTGVARDFEGLGHHVFGDPDVARGGKRLAERRAVNVFEEAARPVDEHLRQGGADAVVLIAAAPPPAVGEVVLQNPAVRDGPATTAVLKPIFWPRGRPCPARSSGRNVPESRGRIISSAGPRVDVLKRDPGGERGHGPIGKHVGPDGFGGRKIGCAQAVDLRQLNSRGSLGRSVPGPTRRRSPRSRVAPAVGRGGATGMPVGVVEGDRKWTVRM